MSNRLTRRQTVSYLATASFMATSPLALADTVPAKAGKALLLEADAQRRVPSSRITLRMVLAEGERKWERRAELAYRQYEVGRQTQMFRFLTPAELSGSSVLTRQAPGTDPAQWIYIPAYHTVRRIAAANRGEAYLGTDYFYEDVLDRRWDEYEIRDLGAEVVDASKLVRVEAVAKAPSLLATTGYARTVFWIEPARKVIVREEYFDRQDALLKRLSNASLKSYGRYLLWDRALVENLRTGHKTFSEVSSRDIEAELSDELFTVQAMKKY